MDQIGGSSSHFLTPQQAEVVFLLVHGYNRHQMASAMGISVRTVDCHKYAIRRRLDMWTDAEITRWAMGWGVAGGSSGY